MGNTGPDAEVRAAGKAAGVFTLEASVELEAFLPEEPQAGVDDFAVVEETALLRDLFERRLDAEGGAVGTVGGERFPGIVRSSNQTPVKLSISDESSGRQEPSLRP